MKLAFEVLPKVFNWIEVRRLGLPGYEYYCLQTTCWPSWRCVLDHCPAESNTRPPPSPVSQSFPPNHPLKFHNILQHPSSPQPLSTSPPHFSPYNPIP